MELLKNELLNLQKLNKRTTDKLYIGRTYVKQQLKIPYVRKRFILC